MKNIFEKVGKWLKEPIVKIPKLKCPHCKEIMEYVEYIHGGYYFVCLNPNCLFCGIERKHIKGE